MPNFFTDNDDIQFLFNHLDLAEIARIQEDDFADAASGVDYAPTDAADALDNYRRILDIVGNLAGPTIAPRADVLTEKRIKVVTVAGLIAEAIRRTHEEESISSLFE